MICPCGVAAAAAAVASASGPARSLERSAGFELRDEQVAIALERALQQELHVRAGLGGLVDDPQRGGGVAGVDGGDQRTCVGAPARPEGGVDLGRTDHDRRAGSGAGEGGDLLEHRQRVAQPAVGAIRDRGEGRIGDPDPLRGRDHAHPLDHRFDRDAPERVTLAA